MDVTVLFNSTAEATLPDLVDIERFGLGKHSFYTAYEA
jgi:hypothetical protein